MYSVIIVFYITDVTEDDIQRLIHNLKLVMVLILHLVAHPAVMENH